MMWGGIDQQLSEVADKPGVSEYQQNTRMTVAGELQRRPGMAPANFSPTGSAAIGMVGAFPTSGAYGCVIDSIGSISGFPITGPIWEPPKLKPPIPGAGCWTMEYITATGGGHATVSPNLDPGGTWSCPGSITVFVGGVLGNAIGHTERSGPGGIIVIDQRLLTPGQFTVDVPLGSDAYPYLTFYTDGGGLVNLNIYPYLYAGDAAGQGPTKSGSGAVCGSPPPGWG